MTNTPQRIHIRHKVLLVDDTNAILSLLCTHLGNLVEVESVSARSLAETREILHQQSGDFFLAVLDLHLPDAPNGEVVDLVRSHGIPVIVLTGSVNDEIRKTMLEKQVMDYVIKRHASDIEYITYLVKRVYENQSVKVMAVDDSATFRRFLGSLLRSYRYQTLTAENGQKALEILDANPDIALIITDYNMPVMNGLQLIQKVRETYRREDLAIIGLSAASKSNLTAMLLKSGANDFLFKPFQVEEFFCRVIQNTNIISYVKQVRNSATRDFLTKVYNRHHLYELGNHLHKAAKRGRLRIAVAMIDADHFKRINDSWGHHVGDEALKALASELTHGLRESDIVARYGGEEFVCIAVIQEEDDPVVQFERIRKGVEQIELYAEGKRVPITVSIGVTTHLSDTLEDMLQIADAAVYQAKERGRNRTVFK